MTEYVADPDDVRVVIETDLEDVEIERWLSRTAREIQREYNVEEDFEDTGHRRDFESALTAYRIASVIDRRVEKESLGSVSVTYEGDVLSRLRSQVARLDPGDAFAPSGVVHQNSNRTVNVVNSQEHSDSHGDAI